MCRQRGALAHSPLLARHCMQDLCIMLDLLPFYSNEAGRTPIHLAAKHGNFSTLKLLLEHTNPRTSGCIDIMDNKKASA